MNTIKTAMLLAALTALFGVVGYFIGGATGMLIALLVAAAMNLFAYWNADKLALSAYGAQEVDEHIAPDLVALVRQLAGRAGLPIPRVFLIENPQPNAFATGRNPQNAAVAVTTGLLRLLSREELAGVIAHELAHIRNRDTLTMTVTATIAGAISAIAQFGFFFGGSHRENNAPGLIGSILLVILAPLAAAIIQMAISRSREYEADRHGAEICGNPLWLATALGKIARGVEYVPNEDAEAHPATAPLFIVNPLSGRAMDNLFATHPATENRIAALHELAVHMGIGGHDPGSFISGAHQGPWGAGGRRRGPWG